MTSPSSPDLARRRRHVVLGGVAALVVLFVVAAVVTVPPMARDLGRDVLAAVPGVGVAEVEFHGQDGELRCSRPLDDPSAVLAAAEAVEGVHEVVLDESCTTAAPAAATTTTVGSPPTSTSTVVATTTTLAATTTVPTPAAVEVVLTDGILVLRGSVASDAQRERLRGAALGALDPANVVDELAVVSGSTLGDDTVERLAALVPAMPLELVSGVASWDGEVLVVLGTYATDEQRAAFADVAQIVGAEVTLEPRPSAGADDVAALEEEMNALVAETPILFEKGSVTISPASQATVERIAGLAERYAGVAVEVQGHTDSEGDATRNLALSQQRADAVVAALVELGVPAADLTAVGYGETQLVVDADGNELPEASRRVVFALEPVG